jgi:hypothetical protein
MLCLIHWHDEPVPDVKNANKLLVLCGDTFGVRQGDVVRRLRISMLRSGQIGASTLR